MLISEVGGRWQGEKLVELTSGAGLKKLSWSLG